MTESEKFVKTIYPDAVAIKLLSGKWIISSNYENIKILTNENSHWYQDYSWEEVALLIKQKMLRKLES